MQVRWKYEAPNDLERIADYLFERAPDLVLELFEAPAGLLTFPHRGRPGRKQGTRELVLTRLPYIVVYAVRDDSHFHRAHSARHAAVAIRNIDSRT